MSGRRRETEQPKARVLVVEDDRAVRESLERALRFEGYDVGTSGDGQDSLALVAEWTPDVLVLDVMLPGLDGLTVARMLRREGRRIPILMLTARDQVGDRVAGLDAGADDYLAKPFALDELLARLRALLRRSDPNGTATELVVKNLTLDPRSRTVTRDGHQIDLTKTEFDLLELLMENAGIVLTRSVIYERIWGFDFDTESNSLDVYIGYLRRKTEEGGKPRLIHTVRGVGYTVRLR